MRKTMVLTAAVLAVAGAVPAVAMAGDGPAADSPGWHPKARNIVYIQGDGMGAAQREFVRLATTGRKGDLVMNRLPVTGMVHTDPDDPEELVTDSAAAATALATGHKTRNGAVGQDAQGRRLLTVLEQAKRAGKSTGLVTTAQVTGASPAAFASHVPSRDLQSDIAKQYITESRPEVLLGGGEDWWLPKGDPGAWPDKPGEESRSTHGNLIEQAKRSGYTYVRNASELAATRAPRLLGLFANEDMVDYGPDGKGAYQPKVALPVMAKKALDTLSANPRGFFLFLEEEGIDGMSHENNAHGVLDAGRALDAAVAEVLRFTRSHPDTLVIIGGDHETGGLAIENTDGAPEGNEDGPFPVPGTKLSLTVDWTSGDHSGVPTPVTATGPGSDRLDGTLDNTDVYRAMVSAAHLS
ncbi:MULTISPECIES: alkaline phosphatase [unclassified Amycolatopsis]|uniref:alkaline phosphatase n=1 Tax=unclassified Amycolatopsis TaxID=2618356 RepID=UPI001EE7BBE2|nr:alkaline phosphatase [Amycolatopsis sp. Poz14]MCG3752295.1 alkaline phosphatase [Amycolatopsis sp. Poz14]